MPSQAAGANDAASVEREYRAHRRAVIGMLRSEFPPLWDDADEIYQHSWVELLALRAKGENVRNVRAMLKRIAWYSARDLADKRHPDSVDPSSLTLQRATDGDLLPDEQAELRIDAATIRLVIDSLEPREAAVLKMRFDEHLPAKEIQQRLGLSPKRLEKVMTAAYKRVLAQLQPDAAGESPWLRRQRSLLLACEAGLASPRQRLRAQQMVDRDPRCAALLREMRSTLEAIAPLLPMPVLHHEERATRTLELLLDRLSDRLTRTRHLPYDLPPGLPGTSVAEQAGGLGGATIGAGAAAKIVAICLAAGGTVAVCVDGARVFDHGASKRHHAARKHTRKAAPKRRLIARAAPSPPPRTPLIVRRKAPRRETPVSSPSSQPPPSPAPPGSSEFGPGATGSSGRPTAAARAPSNGGGEFTP